MIITLESISRINLITFSQCSTQKWNPEVSGYSKRSGYSGILGTPITSIRISGNQEYRIRTLNGLWLPPVTGNNIHDIHNGFAGIEGLAIDGIAIKGAKYRVHILGEDWLGEVNEYDIKNPNCGISGKAIDAIMIKGRTYSTAYMTSITDIINYGKNEISQSSVVNCAKNQIQKYFNEGENNGSNFSSSGLSYFCHEGKIPRDVKEQFNGGIYIVNPQPGDLLFFSSNDDNDNVSHVSIFIGGGMMIHQPNSDRYVQYEEYTGGSNYKGARRYWN